MSELIYGFYPVINAIKKGRAKKLMLATKNKQGNKGYSRKDNKRLLQLLDNAYRQGVKVEYVASHNFIKIINRQFPGATHQLCAAHCSPLDIYDENYLKSIDEFVVNHSTAKAIETNDSSANANSYQYPIYLALDGITDPQNMGSCIRNAAAFSCAGVIFPKNNTSSLGAACVKSSSGMIEWVRLIQVTNLTRAIGIMQDKGFWVVAADGEATISLNQLSCKIPIMLILGSEGKGIQRLAIKRSDFVCRIDTSSRVESLNVSSASAIFLHSIRIRQSQ